MVCQCGQNDLFRRMFIPQIFAILNGLSRELWTQFNIGAIYFMLPMQLYASVSTISYKNSCFSLQKGGAGAEGWSPHIIGKSCSGPIKSLIPTSSTPCQGTWKTNFQKIWKAYLSMQFSAMTDIPGITEYILTEPRHWMSFGWSK